ncbi:hypothetical protein BC827DRAFT_1132657, partial [Russula dissimulans]
LNVVILVLSARVDHFQDEFHVADILPLVLSAITLGITVLACAFRFSAFYSPFRPVITTCSFVLDVVLDNSPTARAPFKIASLLILSIFWLVFNVFSTARWIHSSFDCSAILAGLSDTRCKDIQALKVFIWVNWVVLLLATLGTLCFSMVQHRNGEKHIWTVSLTRFEPRERNERSMAIAYRISQLDYLRFSR